MLKLQDCHKPVLLKNRIPLPGRRRLSLWLTHSLWAKLFCCYTAPLLILFFCWMLGLAHQSEKGELETLKQYQTSLNSQILSALETNGKTLHNQSYSIYSDTDTLLTLYKGPSVEGYYAARLKQKHTTANAMLVTDLFDGFVLIDLSGNTVYFQDRQDSYTTSYNFSEEEWYRTLLNTRTNNTDILFLTLPIIGDRQVAATEKIIYSPITYKPLGLMLCFSYLDNFLQSILPVDAENATFYELYTQEGNCIYSTLHDFSTQASSSGLEAAKEHENTSNLITLSGESFLQTRVESARYGWQLLSYTPYQTPSLLKRLLQNVNLLIFLLLLLVSLSLSMVISLFITKPLSSLTASFQEVEKGNLHAEVSIPGKDELSVIGHSYNQMLKRIRELIREQYQLKQANMQSELEALQSQINPHFLFNTLNSIKIICNSGDPNTCASMIQSLSDLLRYSLSHGQYLVSFEEELTIIRKYLYLQDFRFHDHYSVEYDIDPASLKLLLPRLTLQPLVENAIRHGLEPCEEKGKLILTSKVIGETLYLYIANTGRSLEEPLLHQLNASLETLSCGDILSSPKLGLLNVAYRLKLHYGDRCSVRISNGTYTTVKLTFPAKR